MNKIDQINLINTIQDNYVDKLENIIRYKIATKDELYEINFGSKTGTGKSKMISKLLNKCQDLFFLITTLSRGGLNHQLSNSLKADTLSENYVCYGSCELTANTKKDADDIWAEICDKNINNNPIIWLRDEGHIKTNVFSTAFKKKVSIIVNISATNLNQNDIECNFNDTIMLRHPKLFTMAHFNDAIEKLIEVKKQHSKVSGYNPCMVVRCLDEDISKNLKKAALKKGLKCVDLNDNNVSTLSICDDDNEYDVIINKMKIIEGVDIRRCHVIYIQNNIGKETTNIQLVGRSRRNALLWRNDVDIFAPENAQLLKDTLVSYIYYNNDKGLMQDSNGEFLSACCNIISAESLRPGSLIHVEEGYLTNGFYVYELKDKTGDFHVDVDPDTGFNYVPELTDSYYAEKQMSVNFAPQRDLQANEAYVEGTDIILKKDDFVSEEFNFATGAKVSKFNSSRYHGSINSKIISKILPITEEEFDSGIIRNRFTIYNNFSQVINNKLFAELSGDTFNYSESEYYYTPSITTKLSQDSKWRRFIQKKYKKELEEAPVFTGKNNFNFDKKCNSCLGYLVEYFTKYKLLGEEFLMPHLNQAIQEVIDLDPLFDYQKADATTQDKVAIRACHLKYVEMMTKCYGDTIKSLIRSISVRDLIQANYTEWVNTIFSLSKNAIAFIQANMSYDGKTYPILNCSGIKGLCDFISNDTIIDLKTTNFIDKKYLMQVLSYYELSKTRSDLSIKKVIVYDCVSNKAVILDLNNKGKDNTVVSREDVDDCEQLCVTCVLSSSISLNSIKDDKQYSIKNIAKLIAHTPLFDGHLICNGELCSTSLNGRTSESERIKRQEALDKIISVDVTGLDLEKINIRRDNFTNYCNNIRKYEGISFIDLILKTNLNISSIDFSSCIIQSMQIKDFLTKRDDSWHELCRLEKALQNGATLSEELKITKQMVVNHCSFCWRVFGLPNIIYTDKALELLTSTFSKNLLKTVD